MSKMRFCSVCGHDVRDYARHVGSREHQRNLHPIGSRRGSRAGAKRERRRTARRQLSKRHEDEQWAHMERVERRERRERQGPRHYYGPWTPFGLSAFMGGHPGRALRRAHRHVRRHLRRLTAGRKVRSSS